MKAQMKFGRNRAGPDRQSLSPQLFDSDPSERELATFVDPLECAGPVYMRITDTPQTLRGDPLKWWIGAPILCELPVAGIFVWMDIQGRLPFQPAALKYPFLILAFVSIPAVFWAINRKIGAMPPFFILHKASGTLELPRYGVSIGRKAIQRFVEVRGWKSLDQPSGDCVTAWTRELTVLVKADNGRIARYALGIDRTPLFVWRPMSRKLAELFGVPIAEIKQ